MHSWRQAMQQALYGPRGFFTTGAAPRRTFAPASTPLRSLRRLSRDWPSTSTLALGRRDVSDRRCRCWRRRTADGARRSACRRSCVPGSNSSPLSYDRVPADLAAHHRLDERDPRRSGRAHHRERVARQCALGCLREDSGCEADLVYVLVDDEGREQLGAPIDDDAQAWLAKWWPQDDAAAGDRAEIGSTRDQAWRACADQARPRHRDSHRLWPSASATGVPMVSLAAR